MAFIRSYAAPVTMDGPSPIRPRIPLEIIAYTLWFTQPPYTFDLAASCPFLLAYYRLYRNNFWDIHGFISRYFSNPVEFRALQAQTQLLISGSAVLQFVLREYWPTSDLDLVVGQEHLYSVVGWLTAHGWVITGGVPLATFFQDPSSNMYFPHAGKGVVKFQKPESWFTIDLIVSDSCPKATVLGFHSSESRML
jgi:hypothetical protein